MAEPPAVLASPEKPSWERDVCRGGEIIARAPALPPVIDELSAELVRPRSDGHPIR